TELDVIEKRGSYYYRGDENLAQGRENAKQFLRDHPDIAQEVEQSVRGKLIEGAHMSFEGTGISDDAD
ncbi:MAG: recombinase RecA, partial [Chloroflexi bacterium]|nr:recombinase RecA [Chloroflexota bacterium]